jgi:hypothetical protein
MVANSLDLVDWRSTQPNKEDWQGGEGKGGRGDGHRALLEHLYRWYLCVCERRLKKIEGKTQRQKTRPANLPPICTR